MVVVNCYFVVSRVFLSRASGGGAEDYVAKFTSFVKSRVY